eukprot:6214376-Amphidinium_carterae.1
MLGICVGVSLLLPFLCDLLHDSGSCDGVAALSSPLCWRVLSTLGVWRGGHHLCKSCSRHEFSNHVLVDRYEFELLFCGAKSGMATSSTDEGGFT